MNLETPRSTLPGPSPAPVDRIAGLPPALLLGFALLTFLTLSLWEMSDESCTYDEALNLACGWSNLARRDFRMGPEHPPLSKIVMAIPLALFQPRLPQDAEAWKSNAPFDFGFLFLYQSGNDPDRILFWGRLPALLWSMILIVSVYGAARSFYGPRGGLISLVLITFCPTLLANGHLATNDVAVTTLSFLAVLAFRHYLANWSLLRATGAAALLAAAILTKFSALFLLPVMATLAGTALWRAFGDGSRRGGPEAAVLAAPSVPWFRPLLGFLLIPTLVTGLIWACYLFRYPASPDPGFAFGWDFHTFNASAIGQGFAFARRHHLLPEAFLQGLAVMAESSSARQAYALGLHSLEGWWWYFPFAFLVKTPAAALVLIVAGLFQAGRRFGRGSLADECLFLAAAVFWVFSIRSSVDIGIRLLLPVFPFMIAAAGGIQGPGPASGSSAWNRLGLPALLGGAVVGCLLGAPYFLAYFNLPSRMVSDPCFLLSDSNLDWGQDLGRLKRYMDRHGISEIKMAYHGSASPRHLNLRHQVLPGLTWYTQFLRHEPEWKVASGLRSGDYVAVGATSLVGLVLDDPNRFLKQFGPLKPTARIGGSLFVYRIP